MLTTRPYETINDAVSALSYLMHKSDPELTELAQEIASGASCPVAAVHQWVQQNMYYRKDPGDDELFTSPVRIAKNYRAGITLYSDCDDQALAVSGLLSSLGFKTRIALVGYSPGEISHAYAEVYLPVQRVWLSVDSLSPYPLGFEIPPVEKVVVE